MEIGQTRRIEVGDPSGVGHARRVVFDIAERHGIDHATIGRLAIVVTEAASNLVKHAGGGELLVQTLSHEQARGIDVLTLDRGPGIANMAGAMRDGYSTTGTRGTGIGAIVRQATFVDLHSSAGGGVVLLARVWDVDAPKLSMRVGGVSVSHPLEEICGDQWGVDVGRTRTRAMVADGLGHGPGASAAARAAHDVFVRYPNEVPAVLLERMHHALVATRGAAVAIATIETERRLLRFAGIGNIAGTIETAEVTRSVVSHHGTLGHDARRFQEFTYPWPPHALFVMHSDGIDTRWRLAASPGLSTRDPTVIAGLLFRDHRRARDDATVVVLKDAP